MPLPRPHPRALVAAVTAVTLAAGAATLAGAVTSGAATASEGSVTSIRHARVPADLQSLAVRLDSGVIAARAHVERGRSERAQQSAAARSARSAVESLPVESAPVEDTPGDNAPVEAPAPEPDPADDVRAYAAHVLGGLPGGGAVDIAWDHPAIGNHLGGVRLDEPTVMMLNSRRFEAEPGRVAATVMHEIGHYYQGAAIAARADAAGGWWAAYWELDASLGAVFGGSWMELSADCVAVHLGADWTHYTDSCSAPGAQAAVDALVALEIP